MRTYSSQELLQPENAYLVEEIALLIALSFTEDPGTLWLFNKKESREAYIKSLPPYFRFLTKMAILSDARITVLTDEDMPPSSDTNEATSKQAKQNSSEPSIQMPPNSTMKALAMTIPPHGNKIFESISTPLRAGLFSFLSGSGLTAVWRIVMQLSPAMHALHDRMNPSASKAVKQNKWLLLFLVAHPDAQGKGLGARLLREEQRMVTEALESKDRERYVVEGKTAPLYLESSSTGSARLYRRVGFVDRGELEYGEIGAGEPLRKDASGRVIGGRMWGMTWQPEGTVTG